MARNNSFETFTSCVLVRGSRQSTEWEFQEIFYNSEGSRNVRQQSHRNLPDKE